MKIASYNVNSIRSRMGLLIQWLEKRSVDIDVLCLQEIKTVNEQFPYEEFKRLGYTCSVSGQKAYNGVAICSKAQPEEIITGFSTEVLEEQKRLIGVVINGIEIYSVYAPHGDVRGSEKYQHKLNWYKVFSSFISSRSRAMILAGDFNVALEDMDVYDPVQLKDSIGTMIEEREALRGIIDLGFTDTFRCLHRDEGHYSWWAYTGGAVWKNEGMRIDYILCSNNLVSNLRASEIDTWPRRRRSPIPSDHTPVIADIVI